MKATWYKAIAATTVVEEGIEVRERCRSIRKLKA
jgi:hypothetical protein